MEPRTERFILVTLTQPCAEDVIVDTQRGEVVARVPLRWHLRPLLDLMNEHADDYTEAVGRAYQLQTAF